MISFKATVLLSLLVFALRLPAQAHSASPIQISIQAEPLTIKKGQEVKLRVTLINASSRPFGIALSKPECDNAISVCDASGSRLPRLDGRTFGDAQGRTALMPCMEILSRKIKTIEAGDRADEVLILSKIFDLNKPGVYTVTVSRDIDIDHASPTPTVVLATSNMVRLTVVDAGAVN